jgi:hypothetical protein
LMLSTSKSMEVSQNFVVSKLWTFIFWRSLAEIFRFGHVNFHFWSTCRIIAFFQVERKIHRQTDTFKENRQIES